MESKAIEYIKQNSVFQSKKLIELIKQDLESCYEYKNPSYKQEIKMTKIFQKVKVVN